MRPQVNHAQGVDRSRPFTLVVCTQCRSDEQGEALEVLRAAVRGCRHGLLVTTGCLGRFLDCRTSPGLYAAVQPCTVERHPAGSVTRLGPIRGEADARSVAEWLRAGLKPGHLLPASLRATSSRSQTARFN
ncbi:hypothetical protein EF908_39925 [Streptomyces sp. WAC04770]|nr:hypothetical protein EF908_39925 [Streptomyces sp. WAC04770]